MKERKAFLRIKKYLVLTIVIIGLAILFFSIYMMSLQLSKNDFEYNVDEKMEKVSNLHKDDAIHDRKTIYLTQKNSQWSEIFDFMKFNTEYLESPSKIQSDEMYIIDLNWLMESDYLEIFQKQCKKKAAEIILYNLNAEGLNDENIQKMLGIQKYSQTKISKGITVWNGFWNDQTQSISNYNQEIQNIEIEPGKQVYITENKEDGTPLLYRQMYGKSSLYIVNGNLMEQIPQGIVRGIISQKPTYVYPIVNVSSLAIGHFPTLSIENDKQLQEEYYRDSIHFTQEIVFPEMMLLCQEIQQKPTIYVQSYFKEKNVDVDFLKYIAADIEKWSGELGMYVQNPEDAKDWEKWVHMNIPNQNIHSFMNIEPEFIHPYNVQLENKKSTLLPVKIKNKNQILFTPTYEVLENDESKKLSYWAHAQAYGISTIYVDMQQAYYPQDLDWVEFSKYIKKSIIQTEPYIEKLDATTLYEAALKVKQYVAMEPVIEYKKDKIVVDIKNYTDETDFILRTNKEIKSIANGEFEKIGENQYLITFYKPKGAILLKPSSLEFKD